MAKKKTRTKTYTRKQWLLLAGIIAGMIIVFFVRVAASQEQIKLQQKITSVFFTCDENKSIHASFENDAVNLYMSDGTTMFLPRALSADGARYANKDESFVFWNKGNTAFIEEKGTVQYANCVTK